MTHEWKIYLAGEIHTSWRETVITACETAALPVTFSAPVTDHEASDRCGIRILGEETEAFWADRKGALLNSIRTRTLLNQADVVVACFGEQYRQWNCAFDCGIAVASGKPLILLHPESFNHALKEIDAAAQAVCRSPQEVAKVLQYVIAGTLNVAK